MKLLLKCVEIEPYDGWSVVVLEIISNDPDISTGGTMSFAITNAEGIEKGKFYNLDLQEVQL